MNREHILNTSELYYIKAEDPGVRIYTSSGSLWSDQKLKHIKEELGYPFVQIFRSTVINIDHVEWVNSDKVKLKNGVELKMSRTFKKEIQDIIK